MENSFDFKSTIATSREESEKLLSLGLKKETADMGIYYSELRGCDVVFENERNEFDEDEIPAWSLYRLIEIAFPKGIGIVAVNGMFDNIIKLIEKRINNGTFPKEYLND